MFRKLAAVLFALLLLFTAAGALAQTTVTALAVEPYTEMETAFSCRARITDCNPETGVLGIELIVPEIFLREDIENLHAGDAIWSGSREIPVDTIVRAESEVILNGDTEDQVWLTEDLQGNYRTTDPVTGDSVYIEIGRIEAAVTDRMLLLDANDPEAGDLPKVYTAQEFIAKKTQDPDFCAQDVYIVMGENRELAVIYRYYTPWN